MDSDDQLAFEFVILSGNKGADPRDLSRGRSARFLSMF